MNTSDLKYYRKINNITSSNAKDLYISEMTKDYNNARENAIYRFDILINSIDGKDVYVNDSQTPIRGVIDVKRQQTADTEMQETIQVYPNQVKQGDYVKFKINDTDILRTYLIKSRMEKKHGYDEGIFLETNYILKFMIDGKLYTLPAIVTNNTKYTLGIKSQTSAGFTEADGMFGVIVSYNNDLAKKIRLGQRFIVNEQAWKATQTDHSSVPNVLAILLGETSIDYEVDDLDAEIANAKPSKIHTYKFDIPSIIQVSKDKTANILYSIMDEDGKSIDYSKVVFSSDSNLIKINDTNGATTITGLSAGTGNIKLSVTLNNKLEERTIPFEVKTEVINQVDYKPSYSNGTLLRLMSSTTISIIKYNSGVVDNSLVIEYQLDSAGQKLLNNKNISIVPTNNNGITIKNLTITSPTNFTISIVDKDSKTAILNALKIDLRGVS
jgi:hypothetical protein